MAQVKADEVVSCLQLSARQFQLKEYLPRCQKCQKLVNQHIVIKIIGLDEERQDIQLSLLILLHQLPLIADEPETYILEILSGIFECGIQLPWQLRHKLLAENQIGDEVRKLLCRRLKNLLVIPYQFIIVVLESVKVPTQPSDTDDVHCNFVRPVIDLNHTSLVRLRIFSHLGSNSIAKLNSLIPEDRNQFFNVSETECGRGVLALELVHITFNDNHAITDNQAQEAANFLWLLKVVRVVNKYIGYCFWFC